MQGLSLPYFSNMGMLAGLVASFLGGILSSASPCVLAALPAACAVTSAAPVKKRLGVAVAFTIGTTVSLTALGMASAYLGRSLSLGMRNVTILFGAVLVLAGVLMTGWVGPVGWDVCSVASRRTTGSSSFLFGLLFGTVMTPCATPMLIAIIGLLAARAEPLRGAAYMLAYSLGHCILIFIASLSWDLVQRVMQKYAAGIELARKAAGILLCVAGLMLLNSVITFVYW